MSASERRSKDAEMAKRLKAAGDKRESTRCPMCHGVVSLKGLPAHVTTCGRNKEDKGK